MLLGDWSALWQKSCLGSTDNAIAELGADVNIHLSAAEVHRRNQAGSRTRRMSGGSLEWSIKP